MNEAEVKPNAQQWLVLDLVHRRCLYEQAEESNHQINESSSGDEHWEPLLESFMVFQAQGRAKFCYGSELILKKYGSGQTVSNFNLWLQ